MSFLLYWINLFLFSFLCPANVQISSDFYFSLDAKSYSQSLLEQSFAGEEIFTIPEWSIQGEYQSKVENIRIHLNYELQLKADEKSPTRFNYDLGFKKGYLQIEKISTNATIVKNIGGVLATVYLKGTCRDIVFQTQGPLLFDGGIQLGIKNSTLGASLKTVDYKNEQQWTMSVGQCDGPQGYQQALEKELRALLTDKEKIKNLLMQPLQEQIDKKVATLNSQLFSEKNIPLSDEVVVSLLPASMDLDEGTGQILLKGQIKTQFANSKEEAKHINADMSIAEVQNFSQSGLIISQKYLQTLVSYLHEDGFFYKKYLAQEIPGLGSLFKNRLFQFFLWPDLMNFKKNAAFSFEVLARALPKVKWNKVHQGSAWFDLNADVAVETRTPKEYGERDYGKFLSPLNSQLWMRVYNENLGVGFHKPKLNAKFSWNQFYLKLFRPFQSISAFFFGKKVESALQDYRWKTKLPPLETQGKVFMKPKSLAGNTDWMMLEYAP